MRWTLLIPDTKARISDDVPRVLDIMLNDDVPLPAAVEQLLKHVLERGLYEMSSDPGPGFVRIAELEYIEEGYRYAYYRCALDEDYDTYLLCVAGLMAIFGRIPENIYIKRKEV